MLNLERIFQDERLMRAMTGLNRNRVPDFDDRLMLNATGLWNFYLDAA
jgi:hypothetical protein